MFTKEGGGGGARASAAVHPHLYPLDARLCSQLLHRPPSVVDVVGAVSLRRHGGEIDTARGGKGNMVTSQNITRLCYEMWVNRPEKCYWSEVTEWENPSEVSVD